MHVPFIAVIVSARHFPYQENLPKNDDWPNIKQYIEAQPDINEVILSGGDPL